jgi:magnesium chelatase subunit I
MPLKRVLNSPRIVDDAIPIMPYSWIIGQQQLKTALELSYIAPKLGGVLLSGQRGTGKSTVVRAFSRMVHGRLPVTLPINATEDRVVGGWKIDALLQGRQEWQKGLIEEARDAALYIDEVNLLDDHIVNILLDVTSTGVLNIEREGRHDQLRVTFTLIGTMNPSEGGLRPQLIDRFGLMADITAEKETSVRKRILEAVLEYDAALAGESESVGRLSTARAEDRELSKSLRSARGKVRKVQISDVILALCARLGPELGVEGHRADFVLALAAQALAAKEGFTTVNVSHLSFVAPMVLQHRRIGGQPSWSESDSRRLQAVLDAV